MINVNCKNTPSTCVWRTVTISEQVRPPRSVKPRFRFKMFTNTARRGKVLVKPLSTLGYEVTVITIVVLHLFARQSNYDSPVIGVPASLVISAGFVWEKKKIIFLVRSNTETIVCWNAMNTP